MAASILILLLCIRYALSVPNIILMVADDMGYDDVSYHGSKQINTPTLDKFVANGITLDQFYTQCVCTPSRAALLTSLYPIHTGLVGLIARPDPFGLPLQYTILPEILKNNSYDTWALGKWHLVEVSVKLKSLKCTKSRCSAAPVVFCEIDKWEYTPTWRGFDYFYGYYTGGEDYFTHISGGYFDWREDIGKNCGPNCSKVDIDAYGNYSTYLLTNRTIEILSQYKQPNIDDQSNPNPFFIYLAWQNVHAPAQVPTQYEWAYNDSISDLKRRKYAGMVSAMDEGIGNITSKLKEYGLDDNTLIFFMSDNGAPVDTGDAVGGSNYAMRGGKHSIYDGGTRVLSIMYVPESIADKYQNYKPNVTYHNLMHSVDVGVTILDAVGIDINATTLDGISHWNALMKVSEDVPRDGFYYGHDVPNKYAWAGNNTGIRMNDWKLLNKTGGEPSGWYPTPNASVDDIMDVMVDLNYSLYNLTSDPDEHFDLAMDNMDIVTQLLSLMELEELTAVPQVEPDENCPDPTHPTYPIVGEIWEPWCNSN